MPQTIITKFIPGTNLQTPRVKATAKDETVTVMWNPQLTADRNHAIAAQRLAEKLGWSGFWHGGACYNGNGAVFVRTDNRTTPRFSIAPSIAPEHSRATCN